MLSNTKEHGGVGTIDFDLAVEAADTTKSNQKGGLKIHIAEAGLDRGTSTTSSTTSRIKFSIRTNFTGFPPPNDEDKRH